MVKDRPNADNVYDKFYLIPQILYAVKQSHGEEAQDFRKSHSEFLWRRRYVFLKNEENLADKQGVRLMDMKCRKRKRILA